MSIPLGGKTKGNIEAGHQKQMQNSKILPVQFLFKRFVTGIKSTLCVLIL